MMTHVMKKSEMLLNSFNYLNIVRYKLLIRLQTHSLQTCNTNIAGNYLLQYKTHRKNMTVMLQQ